MLSIATSGPVMAVQFVPLVDLHMAVFPTATQRLLDDPSSNAYDHLLPEAMHAEVCGLQVKVKTLPPGEDGQFAVLRPVLVPPTQLYSVPIRIFRTIPSSEMLRLFMTVWSACAFRWAPVRERSAPTATSITTAKSAIATIISTNVNPFWLVFMAQ